MTNVVLPNAGTEAVRVEPVTSNRAPNVSILDVRVDKSIGFGKYGKMTLQADWFNVVNANTVLNFRTITGPRFNEVIAILDPRVFRVGLRYDF
jgi:hypothetical protein